MFDSKMHGCSSLFEEKLCKSLNFLFGYVRRGVVGENKSDYNRCDDYAKMLSDIIICKVVNIQKSIPMEPAHLCGTISHSCKINSRSIIF